MGTALKLFPVSASQIDTFRDCQRKWGWDKLEGIPRKPNAQAEAGTKVHEVLEAYLETGKLSLDDDYGKIAQAGLKFLPDPGIDKKHIEEWFEFEVEGILYRGKIDLHMPPEDNQSYVLDHKTTSDFKWVKPAEVLGEDVQQVLYGFVSMAMEGTDKAVMRWVYYRRTPKKPKSMKVELVIGREETEERFGRVVHARALQMRDIARDYHAEKLRVKDLPPNAQVCSKYGGCDFVKNCGLTAREMARSIYMQASMAQKMKDKMKNKGAAEAPPEEADATPAETPAAEKKEGKSMKGALSRLKNKAKGVNPPESAEEPAAETETAPSPAEKANDVEKDDDVPRGTSSSIDSRDAFAMASLQGLIARREHALSDPATADSIATLSYEFADAMLKAR